MPRPPPRSALLLAAAALAGCGATAPWTSAPGDAVSHRVTLDPPSLELAGQLGFGTPPMATVVARGLAYGARLGPCEDRTTGPVARVCYAGPATLGVTVRAPELLGPGTYEDVVQLEACTAGACWPLEGDAATLRVRYVVAAETLTATPAALEFERLVGGPPPAEQQLRLDGPPGDGPWTASVASYASGWLAVLPPHGSTTPAVLTATVVGPPPAARTTMTASILLARKGKNLSVPVRLTVRAPSTSVASEPLAFAVREGEALASAPPTVTVATEQDLPVDFLVSATYEEPGVSPWLSFPARVTGPGAFPVGLATTNLPVGRHTATLRVTDAFGGSDARLPVVLDVAPALLAYTPRSLSFVVDAATTPAQATATITLSTAGSPVAWTAAGDVPWLAVAPAAATTDSTAPTAVTVSVVPAALSALSRGAHVGSVQFLFADAPGPASIRVPVSLDLRLPLVSRIGPAYDVEGAARDVVVLGEGIDAAAGLLFGDAPAASVTYDFAGLVATPPALAPGVYPVTVPTAMGVSLGAASYRVIAPCAAGPAAFESPGRKSRVWFDDRTCEVWTADVATGVLERRRAAAGWAGDAIAIPGLIDAAPSIDGTRVITWSDAGTRLVDAAALAYSPSQPIDDSSAYYRGPGSRIAVWADDFASLLSTYDAGYGEYARLVFDPIQLKIRWDGRTTWPFAAVMPRTATALHLLTTSKYLTSPREVDRFTARGPTSWTMSPVAFDADALAVDRLGTSFLALRGGGAAPGDSLLYRMGSGGGPQPGKLPGSIAAALLSQDGARAIAFDAVARTVRVFDLSVPPDAASGLFVEVGAGVAPAADPGADVVLALSADDRILFLSGDARTVVVPLP